MSRFAGWIAFAGFLLVVAGGLVTSTDSGLAVPDWPLSYGSLFPPMVGGIVFEHSHRLIASAVGLLTLALVLWMLAKEPRRWVRWLGLFAFFLVVLQGILGGLTVLWLLPTAVSVTHALLGQTFFAALVVLVTLLSPGWKKGPVAQEASPQTFRLCLFTLFAVYLQLLLGAALRHVSWKPLLITLHLAGAALASLLIFRLGRRIREDHAEDSSMSRPARLLFILAAIQIALGFSALARRAAVLTATAHVAVGALILAVTWVLTLQVARRRPRPRVPVSAYLELSKPRLTCLAVLTALWGYLMGAGMTFRWESFLATLLGATLVGAGASALNQVMEWEADSKMSRTRGRPIPSARLSLEEALAFGVGTSILGLITLSIGTNLLCASLAAGTLSSYLFIYTPLKTRSALCTLFGAVPGALPPLIGWAAGRNSLNLEAWILFSILFLWQLPHFLALAWEFREDYERAGFRMLPVLDPEGGMTFRQMIFYSLALVLVSLIPTAFGFAGWIYFSVALASGLFFLKLGLSTARTRSREGAHRFFLASVLYLPVVFTTLILDRILL